MNFKICFIILFGILFNGCKSDYTKKIEERNAIVAKPCTIDKIDGFKSIKLGNQRKNFKQLVKTDQIQSFDYNDNCFECETAFFFRVKRINVLFDNEDKLNCITVHLDGLLTGEEYQKLQTSIIENFGDPNEKGMLSMQPFEFMDQWCGKNICLSMVATYIESIAKYEVFLQYATPQFTLDY